MDTLRQYCAGFHNHQRGFTLMELLLTITVLGILTAVATPSFIDVIKSQKVKNMGTDIQLALVKARSEAVKRNRNVTLSPNTSTDWTSGWTIPDPDNSGSNIEVRSSFSGVTIAGPASVVYQSSGRISGSTAPTFDIGAPNSSAHQCVSVDLSGRPYIKAAAC
ncbi:MAG TPA: GspH/FimT family pseudopilin [Usitatibacteraceae bacterium]